MTRPDLAGEPSMEEILASIRKIIAEDPPGSRAGPEAARGNAQQSALRSSPLQPSGNDPFLSIPARSTSLPSEPAPAPAARSADPRTFDPFAQSPASPGPAPRPSPTDDIEAQMADILGAVGKRLAEPNKSPASAHPGAVQSAIDSLKHSANVPAGGSSAGGGSSAASNPNAAPGPAAAPSSPGADPFEFALGPSPFARAAAASAVPGAGNTGSAGPQPGSLQIPQPSLQQAPVNRESAGFGAFVPGHGAVDKPAAALNNPKVEVPKSAVPSPEFSAPAASQPVSPGGALPAARSASAEAKNGSAVINAAPSAAAADTSPPWPDAAPAAAKVTTESGSRGAAPSSVEPIGVFGGIDAARGLTSDLDALVPPTAEEIAAMAAVAKSVASKAAATKSAAGDTSASSTEAAVKPHDNFRSSESGSNAAGHKARDEQDPIAAFHAEFGAPAASPPKSAPPQANYARRVDRVAGGMSASAAASAKPEASAGGSRALTTTRFAPHSEPSDANALMVTEAMEETVAELLRPMLRTWLAENMPKIIERALRKELEGNAITDHKTAAE